MAANYISKYREEINKLVFGHKEAKFLNPLQGISAMLDYEELLLKVNIKIKDRNFPIKEFPKERKLRETLQGKNIKKLKTNYWKELLSIINEIARDTNTIESSFSNDLEDLSKRNIRLAFNPFPDTRLPHHFRYGLSNGLNLSFKKLGGWNSAINLFKRNETDVQLHSFSQAIILEKNLKKKFVFIPLFHYSILKVMD